MKITWYNVDVLGENMSVAVNLCQNLIRFPSFGGNLKGIIDFLSDYLAQSGFTVKRLNFSNMQDPQRKKGLKVSSLSQDFKKIKKKEKITNEQLDDLAHMINELEEGKNYLIVYENGTSSKAYAGVSSSIGQQVGVSVSSNTIASKGTAHDVT